MEGHEFFARVTRVRAPEGFEEAVLGRLPAAREARARARRAAYRYAFASSAALLLAAVLVFQPAAPEKDAVLSYAEREALTATPENGGRSAFDRNRFLPVYETMDYASEFRNVQARPRTVYILEQVSEIPSSEIIY